MKGLDDWIEGTYDPNHPANQHEEEVNDRTLEELFEDQDSEKFLDSLNEIREIVRRLREVSKASDNYYFIKKLTEIHHKL